jgi:hypothetical protein
MLQRLVLALGFAVLPAAAMAAPSPAPDQVHDGGTITGKVVTIDYQNDTLGVAAGARGRIAVSVMPSTSIQGRDSAYHTFTDLKTGETVQILSSIADGKYVAQIIRIR